MILERIHSKLERTNATLINHVVFWVGLCFVLLGFFIKPIDWRNVFISVGCSLVASSVASFLTSKYLVRISRVKKIVEYWGLESIYPTRQEMNQSTDNAFIGMESNLDIIAWGLKSFRDAKDSLIKTKVQSGLKIRIIAPHPDSVYVAQREHDEKEVHGQIRQTILHLGSWVDELKSMSPDAANVQIKYYNSLPEDFYFRVDDYIFIGPYRYGISSQQTISYEFKGPSNGFRDYSEYFEKLWNDSAFCTVDCNQEAI